jgi:nucleoside-diphosphate-sugar epimerase
VAVAHEDVGVRYGALEGVGVKVLVTGHQGYIGSVLCPLLREHGHTVVGLDSGFFDGCDFLAPPASVAARQRDLRDLTPADLDGLDAVVHLAALSNDPMGELDPQLTDDINHRAAVHLAALARAAGVQRFIFSSSCSIYGVGSGAALSEDAACRPVSAYAQSKVDAERGIAALATAAFSPVFLRNATAYGVSPRMRVDLVLSNLIGWAVTTGQVRITSDGSPWRPLVHIRDIAAAMIAALHAPRAAIHNQAFNVGRERDNFQVRDIAEIVRATVPGATVTYAAGGTPDRRSYRVDFTKIRMRLPGFIPAWDVERGAREAYDAFRRAHFGPAERDGRKFIRLKQLSYLRETGRLDADLRWLSEDRVRGGEGSRVRSTSPRTLIRRTLEP